MMNDEQLRKFKEAIEAGGTETEACAWAGINAVQLFDHKEGDGGFIDELERLRNLPKILAKVEVLKRLRRASEAEPNPITDAATVPWYLERRDKDYAPKSKSDVTSDGKPIQVVTGFNYIPPAE